MSVLPDWPEIANQLQREAQTCAQASDLARKAGDSSHDTMLVMATAGVVFTGLARAIWAGLGEDVPPPRFIPDNAER